MITNPQYKLMAGQIAKLFCTTDIICTAAMRQRIITNFNNGSFETFLTNIQYGRFYILKYSNWRVHNNHCRNMAITANLTDAITGEAITEEWYYDNENCGDKQWYFQDLNHLLTRYGNTLIDAPIANVTTPEIVKPRLIYNENKPGYGITYSPPSAGGGGGGGGGGGITPKPKQPQPPPQTLPTIPEPGGFDFGGLLKNPIVLIGGAVVLFLLMKK